MPPAGCAGSVCAELRRRLATRVSRTWEARALAACQRWSSASIFSRRRRRRPVHRYHRRRPLSKPRRICDGRAHPALLLARTQRRRRQRRRRQQERRWRQ